MSMTMLTIVQIAGIFALYSLVTIALPALIFHKKVADKRPLEQFMVYFVIGNFFIMHIVFLLQLLHISNRITLILFTVIPGLIVYIRNYDGNIADHILRWLQVLHKAVFGIMGRKTFTKKMIRAAAAGLKHLVNLHLANQHIATSLLVNRHLSNLLFANLHLANLLLPIL